MVEAHEEARHDFARDDLSRDGWLGGRLTLVQPKRGHRVGSDAALLAAAVDLAEGRVVDVGTGVGAVGLALLHRNERLTADLVEIDTFLARLAAENAALNGLGSRARVMHFDIGDALARREARLADETADVVVTNPPFFEAGAVNVSPNEYKARAHVLRVGNPGVATLADWIRASIAILKPGGRFAMIHRPEALTAILAAAENRIGALALLPVHPRAGASAHRLLVSGVKGSHAPLRIAPALILHEPDARLTKEADAVHRGERLIDWGV
jgi:tRNA1(Val) A37 N6-methylase TrmN6